MNKPIGKPHRQYVEERTERDPAFAAALEEFDVDLAFALALARYRERLGLTQRQLAERSGIKQPMIARIERGSQSPRHSTTVRLLQALRARMVVQPDGKVAILPNPEPGLQAVREPIRPPARQWARTVVRVVRGAGRKVNSRAVCVGQ